VWTPDGHALVVSSSDGYLSFLTFDKGELGTVYEKPVVEEAAAAEIKEPSAAKEVAQIESRVVSPVANKSDKPVINVLQPKRKSDKKRAELRQVVNVLQPKKKKPKTTENPAAATETVEEEKVVNILLPKKKIKKSEDTKSVVVLDVDNEVEIKVAQEKVDILLPKKKKKRVDLTLLSAGNAL
jgi:hypothetical protein